MRDSIFYEWVFEEIDKYGDIIDPLFSDKLSDVLSYEKEDEKNRIDIGLVRREGNKDDGETYRIYIYLSNGTLPVYFDDGYKVPKRFHREVSDAQI